MNKPLKAKEQQVAPLRMRNIKVTPKDNNKIENQNDELKKSTKPELKEIKVIHTDGSEKKRHTMDDEIEHDFHPNVVDDLAGQNLNIGRRTATS